MSRRDNRKSHVEHEIQYARSLVRREIELWQQKRKHEVLIELPEPIHAGWERYWIIHPDYTHHVEAPILRRLLPFIQSEQYSHRKDFAERDWKRGGKKTPKSHHFTRLSEAEYFDQLDKDVQPYFSIIYHHPESDWWESRRGVKPATVVLYELRQSHQHKFQSRVRPHYVTHRALPNSKAESELTEIKGKLYGSESWLYRHIIRQHGECQDDWELAPKRQPLVLPDEVIDLNYNSAGGLI